jgi:hypothetical protein
MLGKIILLFLAMVMVLSFTACGEGTEKEAGIPSAQEIIDGVIESFDNIKTYQFDLDMTMHATGKEKDEAVEHTMTMNNSGTLDFDNLQMKVALSGGSDDEMMKVEMYVIDGMMYAKPEAPGEEPMWIKSKAPAEAWGSLSGVSGLNNYQALLQTAQVEVIGSDRVEGIDCYVLKLTPEMGELYQTAMDPTGGGGTGQVLPPVPEELLQDIFRNFSVKQWVAKDTYFLMKVEIDMALETPPDLLEYLNEEGVKSVDITISFLAYNYNQPVTIVLPSEAEEAIEMPVE